MDLLSDICRALRLSGALFLRGEFSKPWGIAAPTTTEMAPLLNPERGCLVVFHIVAKGQCRIELDNGQAALVSAPGLMFMPHGHAHSLADADSRHYKAVSALLPPLPWSEFPVLSDGGGGEESKIVCGYLHFANAASTILLSDLPDLMTFDFRQSEGGGALQAILDYLIAEAEAARPGAAHLVFRSAELFFVELLRHHTQTLGASDKGWFAALNDPLIARAMQTLHRDPALPWTVERLARNVAASRSTLAGRFTEQLGCGPMQYLTQWRIQIAAGKLAEGDVTVAQAAADVGFASESAFYRAFRKATGTSPAAWRHRTSAPTTP